MRSRRRHQCGGSRCGRYRRARCPRGSTGSRNRSLLRTPPALSSMHRRRRSIFRGAVPSARSHERLAGTPARWPVVTFCSGAGSRSHSPRQICAELREMQFRRWAYVVLVIRLAMEKFGGRTEAQLIVDRQEQVEPEVLEQVVRANPVQAVKMMASVVEIRKLAAVPGQAGACPECGARTVVVESRPFLRRLAPALPRRAASGSSGSGTNPGGSESTAPNAVKPPQPTTNMDVLSDNLKVDDP